MLLASSLQALDGGALEVGSEPHLPRLSAPPAIDGRLDDPAWRQALVVDRFFDNWPGDQAPPPVTTVGWLAYDNDYLYVGVRCSDPEPEKIRAPWVERDRVIDQDLVQIDIDARDEGRWSMIFRINPRGVQADGVFDETAGGDDFSPDFHWESAARIDSEGWTAELRIPLATLRYRAIDPQTWRISFFRLYPRRYRYQLASMAIPRGSNCWLCHAPRYGDVTGLGSSASAVVAPFVTGRGSDGPPGGSGRTATDAGVDLKWLPASDLALDLTWNPDFSQVEADAPQVAVNNRFALFYPEKRPFFLEGNDLWNSPIQVINTRTITDPDWGIRLTGRPGNASYTLLAASDPGGGTLILPGAEGSSDIAQPADTRVVFGRFRQTFGRSSIGALTTWRDGGDGYSNSVGGLDLQWYPTASDRFIGQLLWSSTRDPGTARRDDSAVFLRWEKSLSRLSWSLQLDDLGSDFRADSGFVPQVGIRHRQIYSQYDIYRQGTISSFSPHILFDEKRETDGDGIVSQTSAFGLGVDGAVRVVLDWYGRDRERAPNGTIFEKRHWEMTARFLPSRRIPYVQLTARYGDEIDLESSRLGTGGDLALAASIAVTERLQAELSGERRWLDLAAGGRDARLFAATIARARLTYTFTARSFVRVIGEWEALDERDADGSARHLFGGSALYGYRVNWQSILYLGYDNSPATIDPAAHGRHQELFVKVAYAFQPRLGKKRR